MSLPEFPTDTSLTREEAINQIISSIAMEELGLSHIINAEGEKLQYVLGTLKGASGPTPAATIEDVLKVNESVRMVLQSAAESQSLLRNKLQTALSSAVVTGPTGGTGPTGPANGLSAFAGIYNNEDSAVSGEANVPIIALLPYHSSFRNVSFDAPNSMTVLEAGVYHMTYAMLPVFSTNANITIAVRINGENIKATEVSMLASANITTWYSGDTIIDLPAGAVIDMAVTSDVAQTMTFDDQSIESINIFKLD